MLVTWVGKHLPDALIPLVCLCMTTNTKTEIVLSDNDSGWLCPASSATNMQYAACLPLFNSEWSEKKSEEQL